MSKTKVFDTRPLNSDFCSSKSTLNAANLTLGFVEFEKQQNREKSKMYPKSECNSESNYSKIYSCEIKLSKNKKAKS